MIPVPTLDGAPAPSHPPRARRVPPDCGNYSGEHLGLLVGTFREAANLLDGPNPDEALAGLVRRVDDTPSGVA